MTAHACGDAFTSERLPTLRSARLSKALTPPATLDNSLISAFLPNDQKLSHATCDFRTAEDRSAKLKAPIALAPALC